MVSCLLAVVKSTAVLILTSDNHIATSSSVDDPKLVMKSITVVHCWSAPRSRSTALLYSFEARGDDCVAIDEPLYREWLVKKGDTVARPYFRELVEGIPPEGCEDEAKQWQRELMSLDQRIFAAARKLESGGVVFCKHMAKHSFLYDFNNECSIDDDNIQIYHRHLLLIRDPVAVLSSWGVSGDVHGNNPTGDEVGIVPLLSIYSNLESRSKDQGHPVILESDDLVADPQKTLANVCAGLSIPYKESMMKWPPGRHDCDGPWAKWWYENVHKSTGWNIKPKEYYPGTARYRTMDVVFMRALEAAFPAYEFLRRLSFSYSQRGPEKKNLYEDTRNENLLVYIGAPGFGRLLPRDMAGVSPFDSSVQGGDACWEDFRVSKGKILLLEIGLRRLFLSAKALAFENMHTKDQVIEAIFRTLAANGMRDGAGVHLILTRGEKSTSSMDPKFSVYGTTLIVLAEWRTANNKSKGIKLLSASQRRSPQSACDSNIHHNNMINKIIPKIQANIASTDDALLLDVNGYVCETNRASVFMVDDQGVLYTPHPDHCSPGIGRGAVLALVEELGIKVEIKRLALAEFHAAQEVFTADTCLTPVTMIDGRIIGNGERGEITKRLQDAYELMLERPDSATEIPQFA